MQSPTAILSPIIADDVLDNPTLNILNAGITVTLEALKLWAEESLSTDIAFLNTANWESLRQAWADGDFTQLPKLEIRTGAELQQAKEPSPAAIIPFIFQQILSSTPDLKQSVECCSKKLVTLLMLK